MSNKITCTALNPETGVYTFVNTQSNTFDGERAISFTCTAQELEVWTKSANNITAMCDAPFPTGPGIFDHPIMSFALYSLVMMISGDEELVGAEMTLTASKKVKP